MDAYIDGMAAGKSLEVSEKMLEGQQAVADRTRVRGFARGFVYNVSTRQEHMGKLKTPSWWFIMIIANMPIYGVAQAYFLLLFILMDKGDIFQLVNFIQTLKVASVVSIGFIPAVTGGIMVYLDY